MEEKKIVCRSCTGMSAGDEELLDSLLKHSESPYRVVGACRDCDESSDVEATGTLEDALSTLGEFSREIWQLWTENRLPLAVFYYICGRK